MRSRKSALLVAQGDFYHKTKIAQSLRFNSADSTRLDWTPAGASDNDYLVTISAWVKRCELGYNQCVFSAHVDANNYGEVFFNADDQLRVRTFTGGTCRGDLMTVQKLRDVTNWYNIVLALDSASLNWDFFINGVEVDTTVNTAIANYPIRFNSSNQRHFGYSYYNTMKCDLYLSKVEVVDGEILGPYSFGDMKSGVWIPKKYVGAYGTNGYYLDFSNATGLGDDVSGNGNDFTPTNLNADDQVVDTPTNNYPTLNALTFNTSSVGMSNGALNVTYGTANWVTALATSAFPESGKWYFEHKFGTDLVYAVTGVKKTNQGNSTLTVASFIGDSDAAGWGLFSSGGEYRKYFNGAYSSMSGATPAANDVMQVAVDIDAGKVWFGVNGTWLDSGNPETGANPAYSGLPTELIPGVSVHSNSDTTRYVNFGQLGFAHTPPTGFKALCSKNMPEPAVIDGTTGMGSVLYTGDGQDNRDISGYNFEPSLVWIKSRNSAAYHHYQVDDQRGVTNTLRSSAIIAETVEDSVLAFNNDGYQLGQYAGINHNLTTYAGWCFKVAPEFGFDIVTYTGDGVAGRTVAHNLGAEPEMIIVKNRTNGGADWVVYHHHLINRTDPETDYGVLSGYTPWADSTDRWNDTAPTATHFTVGSGNATNQNGNPLVAYVFRSIPGFSKVFSYTANNSNLGPYVYFGFKPQFMFLKNAFDSISWRMYDTARNPYNGPNARELRPNTTAAEVGDGQFDWLSNGIKIHTSGTSAYGFNYTGTYAGIAFGANPFKYSNAF